MVKGPPKKKAISKKNRHVEKPQTRAEVEELMESITGEEFKDALKRASRKAGQGKGMIKADLRG